MNIIEEIQTQLGYPPLEKIDPNTEEVKTNIASPLAQATIPAVLVALYKYSRNDEDAAVMGNAFENVNYRREVLGSDINTVAERIADYASVSTETAKTEMDKVAAKALEIIKREVGAEKNYKTTRDFFGQQRHDILAYLPPQLQIGAVLNDNTIDDNTNKMEGPISGIMHTIEKLFSGSEKENTKKD